MIGAHFIWKHRKTLLILLGQLVAFLVLLSSSYAQNADGYIYGRVYTYNQVYQGQLRWGKEESFWNDFFNAAKYANGSYETIRQTKGEDDFWNNIDWSISSIWDNQRHQTHEFSTQFGNIAAIIIGTRSQVDLQLKNGTQIKLSGRGYNDIGTRVTIFDDELGQVKIEWNRIEKIEFLPTPKNFEPEGGRPIYGTVETFRRGTYTGYIQWDHDERLGRDVLDGDSRDGDMSIPFSKIKSIEKDGNGSYVTMKSGRSMFLRGSNDVNSDNDGIIVTVPGIGKIDIPWRVFEKITFEEVNGSGPGYDDFKAPKGLIGSVYTYNKDEFKGRIIYDLDEASEVETLEAKDDEIEYIIPFGNIKQITPKNSDYCDIKLKNGDRLLLGDRRDVSSRNDGVLVFEKNKKDPIYIKWRDIVEIIFD